MNTIRSWAGFEVAEGIQVCGMEEEMGTEFWMGSVMGKGYMRDQDVVCRIEGPVTSFCVVCDEPSAANCLKWTVTGVFDKAVVMLFIFIVGWLTVLMGLRELTRRESYITHIVISTDRLVHRTDKRFLSVALDTSLIKDGWVHKNIRWVKLLALKWLW